MRLFQLHRNEDESGVSGTGIVAEGVEFTDGKCALSWLTDKSSKGFYDCIQHIEDIHGHNGKTIIKWLTESEAKKYSLTYKKHKQKTASIFKEYKCNEARITNPDIVCNTCTCWKMTRLSCS
jgi:hypothetical protein